MSKFVTSSLAAFFVPGVFCLFVAPAKDFGHSPPVFLCPLLSPLQQPPSLFGIAVIFPVPRFVFPALVLCYGTLRTVFLIAAPYGILLTTDGAYVSRAKRASSTGLFPPVLLSVALASPLCPASWAIFSRCAAKEGHATSAGFRAKTWIYLVAHYL